MDSITATFSPERETPNTIRFEEQVEDGEQAIIGKLYVRKSALGDTTPDTLMVTIGD